MTDGVFRPAAANAACDTPPTFLPARPISQANLAALTERVRRRAIRWFRMQRLLDAAAAADMLAWDTAGFQSMRASGSRSSTATCRAIFGVLSTFSDPLPGHHSRLNGSP